MADWLDIPGPEEKHSDEFSVCGFLGFFCFIYPRVGAEEGSNLKLLMGTGKKKVPQSLLSLAKLSGKR